jgi:hypothetical protein
MQVQRLQSNTVASNRAALVDVQHGLCFTSRALLIGVAAWVAHQGVAATPRDGVYRTRSDRGRHLDHYSRDGSASVHTGKQAGDGIDHASPAEEVITCGSDSRPADHRLPRQNRRKRW